MTEPVEKETTLTLDEIGYLISLLETRIVESQRLISRFNNSTFHPDVISHCVSIRLEAIKRCKLIYEKLDSLSKLTF